MSTGSNQAWPQAALNNLERRQQVRLDGLRSGLQAAVSLDIAATARRQDLEVQRRFDALERSFRQRPFARDWTTDATADSSTYTVIRSGKVPAGQVWDVRRGSIAGGGTTADAFSTLTGVLALLVKQTLMAKTTSVLEPQFQLVNSTGPVPNDYSFSRGTLVLKNGEELSIVVKGAASGQLLSATWGIEAYPETAFIEP